MEQRHIVFGVLLLVAIPAVTALTVSGTQERWPVRSGNQGQQEHGPDTTGAAVWAHLQQADYQQDWTLWPGKGRLYSGQEPHGMLLTTFLNPLAKEALDGGAERMPPGAIIVKENYMPDSTLAAVTVMYKVRGYNADHHDWFFTKHLPDGELDTMPNGMPMEGRVPGCQNCHGAQRANDYIFTGRLGRG